MDSLNDHCVDTCLYFLHLGGIERCQAESETACFCTYTHARYQICAVPEVPTPVPEHAGYQGLGSMQGAPERALGGCARATTTYSGVRERAKRARSAKAGSRSARAPLSFTAASLSRLIGIPRKL